MRLLLAAAVCTLAGAVAASPQDEKLESVMDAARARAAGVAAPVPDAARLQEREALLREGEAALARSEVEAAQRAFDRAASISHAADTEIGLVRSYMQGGEYRRALAFVAHTAAAHREAAGGAALYSWLLYVGGQDAAARRLLDEAQARLPADPLFSDMQRLLRAPSPLAEGRLLLAPARLAPYGSLEGLPGGARIAGTAVLVDEGRRALVPVKTVAGRKTFWVRNGMGQASAATIEKRDTATGLALARLDKALPWPAGAGATERAPFPGSPAFAVEYSASSRPLPGWPLLKAGFAGGASADGARRALGVELAPGPRGGPVFDQSGRLTGIAVREPEGDRLVPAAQLRSIFGDVLGAARPAAQRVGTDQIYESALRSALQVITPGTPQRQVTRNRHETSLECRDGQADPETAAAAVRFEPGPAEGRQAPA